MEILVIVMSIFMCAMAVAMVLLFLRKPQVGIPPEEMDKRIQAEKDVFERLLKALDETHKADTEALRESFGNLASQKLAEKSEDLSKENVKNVEPLFKKMEDAFNRLTAASNDAKDKNIELSTSLEAKLAEVGRNAQSLGKQADDFVTALKGGNKLQGNWGEGILTQVLEDAGLKQGVNFVTQTGDRDSGLPDVTVYDGAHKRILIDSKVNIIDFIKAVNAGREGNKTAFDQCMNDHAVSVYKQIKNLADKHYPEKMKAKDDDPNSDYSEVVIMMMPSEATYAAAVSADPKLISFANSQNVVLSSPQMLFGYLVLFRMGLDRQQINKHYQDIVKNAGYIVERMDAAFKALETIKSKLDEAQDAYADALGKLGNGTNNQNVLGAAREISRLVETKKELRSSAFKV